jgi:nitric oxide reductase activation protein
MARSILARLHPIEAQPRFSVGAMAARVKGWLTAAPGSDERRRPPPSPEAGALYARDLSAVLPSVRAFVSQIERIIRRRTASLQIAFSLCIDTSASIAPQAPELQRATILTQAALERLRIPYEVRGFGSHQVCYKRFDEHNPQRLGALARNVAGGTPMLGAVQHAVHSLQARPEQTRILFVICDGAPFQRPQVAQAIHDARLRGIRPFCVVLNGMDVSDLFASDWVAIAHVDEIPNVVGRKLRESLRAHHA